LAVPIAHKITTTPCAHTSSRIWNPSARIAKSVTRPNPSQLDYLDEPCRDHFAAAKSYLDKLSIPYTINPKIVRGLDYYTNTAFEIVYEGIGAQNSLAGGGRYNGLIEQIGGKPTPAIGFAGGIERLLIALENEGISLGESPGTDLYLIPMGEQARDFILPWINRWRMEGITIGFDPDKSSFKSQLKAANNSQARFAAIIGEDELAQESLMLKDMQSGEQSLIKLSELVSTLKTKLNH
jgi:histidyl-tRNA synthetase